MCWPICMISGTWLHSSCMCYSPQPPPGSPSFHFYLYTHNCFICLSHPNYSHWITECFSVHLLSTCTLSLSFTSLPSFSLLFIGFLHSIRTSLSLFSIVFIFLPNFFYIIKVLPFLFPSDVLLIYANPIFFIILFYH